MARFARIEDGLVREIGHFDSIQGRFHPSLVWVDCPAEVEEQWLHEDGAFIAPEPPEPVVIPEMLTTDAQEAAATPEHPNAKVEAIRVILAKSDADITQAELKFLILAMARFFFRLFLAGWRG